ncbi:Transcriptional activator protein Anr [Cupriavidus yeoncheonensis]|uniref:Transcriptional activator protein Anr n=1 Tax=Cupriavidus yeoncheonensis TaxID=1462994 RepID=A0A916IYE0_9BURK|nr:helix-turn-helix domain-containing protein [Cupriavidus yeoncheonensis]CAG2152569.1 Transcriptional activator protein Anr [Cupriavidus yeoncheonensis]
MKQTDITRLVPLVRRRVRLLKGDTLYRPGDDAHTIYAVRAGTIRTSMCTAGGRNHVVAFHLPGEIVGLDSVAHATHTCEATALEDTSLCVIPSAALKAQAAQLTSLRDRLLEAFSLEARRERDQAIVLGQMTAEERVATFVLGLSARLSARGFAASEFLLRMTREDIGSHLGLKLETVSRIFSRMAGAGMIRVRSRHLTILDRVKLEDVTKGHSPLPQRAAVALL